ncbi:hypothetical protein DV736_g1317, partial [Chaetothyriales sp. CBS 134916]
MATVYSYQNHWSELTPDSLALIKSRDPELDGDIFSDAGTVHSSLLRISIKETSFARLPYGLTVEAESKFSALMEVLSNANKEASALRMIWETMKHELERFLQEHEAVLAQANLHETCDSLFRKDSQHERELELLRGRLKQAESERNSATETSERYHHDLNKALRDRTELTAKLTEVTSSYDSSHKEVISLTGTLKSIEAERDGTVQRADKLKEEVKEFKTASAEDAREAQEATAKYKNVLREIVRLKETLTATEVERDDHLQTAESLRRQIKTQAKDIKDWTARSTESSHKYNTTRRQVITLQEILQAIEVARDQDHETLKRTRSSLHSITDERNELEDKLTTAKKHLDEQKQHATIAREDLIKTEEKKSEFREEVMSLTAKIRYIELEPDEVRSRTEQQMSKIKQFEEQINVIQRKEHEAIEGRTTLEADLKHSRQRYSQATETITFNSDRIEDLENSIDSLEELVQDTKEQLKLAVSARQSADRERDTYSTKYEKKCLEVNQFKEHILGRGGSLSHSQGHLQMSKGSSSIRNISSHSYSLTSENSTVTATANTAATSAHDEQASSTNGEKDKQWPDRETAESTTATGLKFIAQLKRSTDKNGRGIVGAFLDLPNRNEYPDYYQQIAMPLSVTMIEDKLNQGRYHTMTEFESDLKRVVQNAKDYNDSRSEIFQDAERIRKALSNFMPKHNPAYEDPDYRAVPTPIPQGLLDRMRESSVSTNTTVPDRVKLVLKRRSSQAMLELLDNLSEQENAVNFEKKPPKRDYPDYYKLIEQPTSISDAKILVRQGKVGDWDSLAREVRLIWDNAKEYNEPGSDIYAMTEALESWFEEQVQAAGAAPRARLPRLSLSQPKKTGIKLKMGTTTPTPNISGGAVDSESLKRQKEEMSQALSRANRGSSRSLANGTPDPVSSAASVTRSLSSVEPSDVTMTGPTPSPVTPSVLSTTQLPTPVMNGVPPSMQAPAVNGRQHPDVPGSHSSASSRSIYSASNNPIERKYRDPGKGLGNALIASVTYMTHPNLPGDPKWKLQRFASASKTQTSSYIYLPSSHFYLRLIPTLTDELRSRKNYKVCVSANWQSVQPGSAVPPTYDFRLQPGENTIVVDVIADLKSGEKKDYAPPQMQFDFERIQLVIVLVDRSD